LGQGREAVKQLLEDNPELKEEIEAKVRLALSTPKS
jgi:recombination protein RecA